MAMQTYMQLWMRQISQNPTLDKKKKITDSQ